MLSSIISGVKKLFKIKQEVPKEEKTHSEDGFPLLVEGHWYTGSWYMWLCKANVLDYGDRLSGDKANKVSPADGEIAFNHWRCGIDSDNTSNLIDGLIPAIKINGKIGLYRIVKGPYFRKELRSDLAGWDDCKEIDLEFVKAI